MKHKLSGILLISLLCIAFSISSVKADFGDYSGDSDYSYSYDDYDDYDSGSSWDYDYSYDYTTGGYDSWGYDYGDSYSNSYDYDYSDSGSSSYYEPAGSPSGWYTSSTNYSNTDFVAGLIILIVIIFLIWKVLHKSSSSPRTRPMGILPPSAARYQSASERQANLRALHESDPNFNETDFCQDASNLYVRLQNAWTAKDLEPVRPALSDAFFAQMEKQLARHIANGTTNYVENISVLSTDIIGCEKDGTNDILTVWLNARIIDYTKNDATEKVISGSTRKEKFMTYQWQFIRPHGHKTAADKPGVDSKHCPNCGAPIDMNQSAVCEYCSATLKASDHDWVLNSIKGIRQATAG